MIPPRKHYELYAINHDLDKKPIGTILLDMAKSLRDDLPFPIQAIALLDIRKSHNVGTIRKKAAELIELFSPPEAPQVSDANEEKIKAIEKVFESPAYKAFISAERGIKMSALEDGFQVSPDVDPRPVKEMTYDELGLFRRDILALLTYLDKEES